MNWKFLPVEIGPIESAQVFQRPGGYFVQLVVAQVQWFQIIGHGPGTTKCTSVILEHFFWNSLKKIKILLEEKIADVTYFVAHEAEGLDAGPGCWLGRRIPQRRQHVGHFHSRTDDVHVSDLTRRQHCNPIQSQVNWNLSKLNLK